MRDRPETPPWRALNEALIEASAKAPRSAISSAILRVKSWSSASGTTWLTKPHSSAWRAVSLGLRYHISLARFLPIRSSRYQVPWPPSKLPIIGPTCRNMALSLAIVMSHTTCSTLPPPTAKPLTEAMTGFCSLSMASYISSVGSTPAYSSVSCIPSLRPPMQKNFSPAPVTTITRVRVSRRMPSMQSRISWHIRGVNMLPSCGRFSVIVPMGPSSAYVISSNCMGCSCQTMRCARSRSICAAAQPSHWPSTSWVWAPSLGGGSAVPSVRPSKRMPRPTWGMGPSGPSIRERKGGAVGVDEWGYGLDQVFARGASQGIAGEPGIDRYFRLAHGVPEALPDRVIAKPQGHRGVGGMKNLVNPDNALPPPRPRVGGGGGGKKTGQSGGAPAPPAGAAAELTRAQVGHQPRRHEARHALDHRDIDHAALAIALAAPQPAQSRPRGIPPAQQICGRCAHLLRRRTGLAGQIHDAGIAFRDQVVAGQIRAARTDPEAGDGDMDQTRIEPHQHIGIQAQLALRARHQVQQDHIALGHQLPQHLPAGRRSHIHRQALLATVDAHEPERLAMQERRPPGAGIIAGAGLFHLHDRGAEVGQQLAGIRPRDRPGQIEDFQARQQVERSSGFGRQAMQRERGFWRRHCMVSCKARAMPCAFIR